MCKYVFENMHVEPNSKALKVFSGKGPYPIATPQAKALLTHFVYYLPEKFLCTCKQIHAVLHLVWGWILYFTYTLFWIWFHIGT